MNDQTDRRTMNEPGTPVIPMINWTGLWTLYLKEVRRFFKVQLQTIWGPALTTLLFLVIFTVALGRAGRTVLGVHFADFIAPRSEERSVGKECVGKCRLRGLAYH